MSNKILVVDDEPSIRKIVGDFLRKSGYEIIEAADGLEALSEFEMNPDTALIILDVMMPRLDGYKTLSRIRESSKVPVIMLTAKSEEKDELQGFDLGVDEYVTKPFSPRTLVARVEAILRRSGVSSPDDRLECDGIVIDKAAHEVSIDGNVIDLSSKEFELLTYFLENRGRALSREMILNNVWNYDYYGDARTIDTHVKKLRAKMGEKGARIQTVWKYGYKFEA